MQVPIIRSHQEKGEIFFKQVKNYLFNMKDLIGQGNFSKVYKGFNQLTGQVVAVKIVKQKTLRSKKIQELLYSQIQILKNLNHPNILKCHEIFTSQTNCYIITELCDGGDLDSHIKNEGAMAQQAASIYIRDIFKGLLYLSQCNIIHRDLKISNIFIHNGIVKIADFGFAKHSKTIFKDASIGSPVYMSPQGFLFNIYGPKTDVWAFGMLIYQLLHGKNMFSDLRTQKQLKNQLQIPINQNRFDNKLSKQIKTVMLRCLQLDQNQRISIKELASLDYFKSYQPFLLTPQYHEKLNNKAGSLLGQKQKKLSLLFCGEICGIDGSEVQIKQQNSKILQNLYCLTSQKRRSVSASFSNIKYIKDKDPIFSSNLTFKECIHILHYCRLVYKHIKLIHQYGIKDVDQQKNLAIWLGTIIKKLIVLIQQGKVNYQGETNTPNQRKLTKIIREYIKKYSLQLNLQLQQISLQRSACVTYETIYKSFVNSLCALDSQISRKYTAKLLLIGISMAMICQSTKVLKNCHQLSDYRSLFKLKQIQHYLSLDKNQLDFSFYWQIKQRALYM